MQLKPVVVYEISCTFPEWANYFSLHGAFYHIVSKSSAKQLVPQVAVM
jgi:hypothetical protein